MPYIKQEDRDKLADGQSARLPGELNYLITTEIKTYLDTHGLSYSTINDIIGAIESAKLEFYTRIVEPYERTKISENGDVY